MALYKIYNGNAPTTAALSPVATGTAIKTLLQLKPSATLAMKIVEWGISFDSATDFLRIKCELLETDVDATVTAHTTAGIVKFDAAAIMGGNPTTNLIQCSTTGTGFTATTEGSPTLSRLFDYQLISPINQYVYQFPLGRECYLTPGSTSRIRVTSGTTVNAVCYLLVEV